RGSLTIRVQRTTESGSGSPDATPGATTSSGGSGGTGGSSAAVSGGTSPSASSEVPVSSSSGELLHPAASAVAARPTRKLRRSINGPPAPAGSLVRTPPAPPPLDRLRLDPATPPAV